LIESYYSTGFFDYETENKVVENYKALA